MCLSFMNKMNETACTCGKTHQFRAEICVGSGVLARIPEYLQNYSTKKVFLLSDENTYRVAGKRVSEILENCGIAFVNYCFSHFPVEPDEFSTGAAFLHFDTSCDMIIAVGSGVINDTENYSSCRS